MKETITLILPVLVPIIMGIVILVGSEFKKNRTLLIGATLGTMAVGLVLTFLALKEGGVLTLWRLTDAITISFAVDGISRLFAALASVVWFLVGIYATVYMTHERDERRFFGFYLIVLGVLIGLSFSANLVTMYIFYEMMTLTSLPLVLHELTKEAVMAGLKYLFYSVAGAFLALFGIFFLASISPDLTFTPGGVLGGVALEGNYGMLLAAAFCMLLGFGTKAGMFPLHGWLPTAHPVAPAPASAVLSGVITKFGLFAIVRVMFYIIGPELIRGTWVQQMWLLLSLLTVFMGSMLAYKEPVLKKRLAYSTVSQVSYMLFGLGLLTPLGFVGGLAHVVFHSLIKTALFLTAGAIIFKTGWTKVEQMKGLGKVMPVMLGCYTVVSLGLIGIPPTSGFVSKWYLATGALASGTGAWSWIGPVVLLLSALLTAGYLLPLTIQGFFPGEEFRGASLKNMERQEPSWQMLMPVILLAGATLWLGCFSGPFLQMLQTIAASVL